MNPRMTRLPMPDWTRAGETWRVEEEPYMEIVEPGGVCEERGCREDAIAATRRSGRLICERHLYEFRMWVERERVVSWRLSR